MSKLHNTSNPLMFHWGDYEVTQWKRVSKYVPTLNGTWFNMHRFFIHNQIVIKDCFGFSLKQVVPAMYKHGLIESNWEESGMASGSSEVAVSYYSTDSTQISTDTNNTWSEFKQYNQTDTIVLWEIMEYLRKNH